MLSAGVVVVVVVPNMSDHTLIFQRNHYVHKQVSFFCSTILQGKKVHIPFVLVDVVVVDEVPLGVDVAGVDPGASTGGGGGLGTRPGGAGGGRLVLPPPESFSLSRSLSLSRSPLSRSRSLSLSRFRLGALPLVRERPPSL